MPASGPLACSLALLLPSHPMWVRSLHAPLPCGQSHASWSNDSESRNESRAPRLVRGSLVSSVLIRTATHVRFWMEAGIALCIQPLQACAIHCGSACHMGESPVITCISHSLEGQPSARDVLVQCPCGCGCSIAALSWEFPPAGAMPRLATLHQVHLQTCHSTDI